MSTELAIINLQREMERQNHILSEMLEEMRKTNNRIPERTGNTTEELKKSMQEEVKELEKILSRLAHDFRTLQTEQGISETRKEWLDICSRNMTTYAGQIDNIVDGV